MHPDLDPHSQYGSGSRTAKLIRIHADPDLDTQHRMLPIYLDPFILIPKHTGALSIFYCDAFIQDPRFGRQSGPSKSVT
jgi:hypothetical protein